MVNLGVASGEQASASDLMVRDVTEGSVSRQTLVVREEDTNTGNVKLSDLGVSLNLRAGARDQGRASPKSDIWSIGCTVIELLTGRPPYGDIGNAMTVMFRIVEDESPPTPERFSIPLVAFLKECFHEGSNYLSMR
ncbi:hypothetical protein EDB85DRAFT_1921172, partial [Lactarius pseudohatsudake]